MNSDKFEVIVDEITEYFEKRIVIRNETNGRSFDSSSQLRGQDKKRREMHCSSAHFTKFLYSTLFSLNREIFLKKYNEHYKQTLNGSTFAKRDAHLSDIRPDA